MTETPVTDAVVEAKCGTHYHHALAECSRKLEAENNALKERLRIAMLFIEEWANYWAYGMEQPEGAVPSAEDDAKCNSFGERASEMVIDNRRFLAGTEGRANGA